MEETLLFIEGNQTWIYIILGLAGLIYLRLSLKRYRELRSAFFGLEEERARQRLSRSLVMFGLVLLGLAGVFVLTTFASPAIPIAERPTAMPTVSLLSTPGQESTPGEGLESATPLGEGTQKGAGCQNPDARITLPLEGESVSGVIDVRGTANIPGFAFYRIEVNNLKPGSAWRALLAGTQTVCDSGCPVQELLGRWDTSLMTPGEYGLRLVVTDTAGNAPLPCEIHVNVLPSQ
jgi:hypothetical protein